MTETAQGATAAVQEEEKRTVVRTQKVKKVYQMGEIEVHALRGVDMEIYTGEYLSIMGPSGSGKSTFFNMVGGLDKPTEGKVYIDEVDVAHGRTGTALEAARVAIRRSRSPTPSGTAARIGPPPLCLRPSPLCCRCPQRRRRRARHYRRLQRGLGPDQGAQLRARQPDRARRGYLLRTHHAHHLPAEPGAHGHQMPDPAVAPGNHR